MAVALSLALHVGLLAGFGPPRLLSGVAWRANTVHLRLLHSSAVVTPQTTPILIDAPIGGVPSVVQSSASAAPMDGQGAGPSQGESANSPAPAASALRPATDYRAISGLDVAPRALDAIEPEYPEAAGSIEGTVLLRLLINSAGGVDEAAVVRATPPGYFEASAIAAFSKARFSPGYFLGIPVKSQLLIEVGYTPINRGGAVSGQAR